MSIYWGLSKKLKNASLSPSKTDIFFVKSNVFILTYINPNYALEIAKGGCRIEEAIKKYF